MSNIKPIKITNETGAGYKTEIEIDGKPVEFLSNIEEVNINIPADGAVQITLTMWTDDLVMESDKARLFIEELTFEDGLEEE